MVLNYTRVHGATALLPCFFPILPHIKAPCPSVGAAIFYSISVVLSEISLIVISFYDHFPEVKGIF